MFADVAEICTLAEIEPADVDLLVHGTTIATNALLQYEGAEHRIDPLERGWNNRQPIRQADLVAALDILTLDGGVRLNRVAAA